MAWKTRRIKMKKKIKRVDQELCLTLEWARRKRERWNRLARLRGLDAPKVILCHARRLAHEASRCYRILTLRGVPLWLKIFLIWITKVIHRSWRENLVFFLGWALDRVQGNGMGYIEAHSFSKILNEMRKHVEIYLGEKRAHVTERILDSVSLKTVQDFVWLSTWSPLKEEVDKKIRRTKWSGSKTTSRTSRLKSKGRRKGRMSRRSLKASHSRTKSTKRTGKKS